MDPSEKVTNAWFCGHTPLSDLGVEQSKKMQRFYVDSNPTGILRSAMNRTGTTMEASYGRDVVWGKNGDEDTVMKHGGRDIPVIACSVSKS